MSVETSWIIIYHEKLRLTRSGRSNLSHLYHHICKVTSSSRLSSTLGFLQNLRNKTAKAVWLSLRSTMKLVYNFVVRWLRTWDSLTKVWSSSSYTTCSTLYCTVLSCTSVFVFSLTRPAPIHLPGLLLRS